MGPSPSTCRAVGTGRTRVTTRPGVDAQFSLTTEQLAWPVATELGEHDYPQLLVSPHPDVDRALREATDALALCWGAYPRTWSQSLLDRRKRDRFTDPCAGRVVACLLQLATVDLTFRRYDTNGHCSDEHRAARKPALSVPGSGEIVQRGRQSRRVICSVDPVGHIVGPDVDA